MASSASQQTIDQGRLDQFMGQFVGDLGAALSVATVVLGDKLGLYKAMADSAPVTSAELAERTGTEERYVREWLAAQAAGGYVTYDAASESFTLPPEQAMALAQDDSPAFIPGAFQLAASLVRTRRRSPRRSAGQWGGLARARWRSVLRHGALLPPRLHRQPRPKLDPRTRGRRREAHRRWPRGRHRMRARRLDADPRRGVPEVEVRRL